MSNIEKIRKEIERRKKENMYVDLPMSIGRYYEDRDILAFIDSLPEEKATCKTCGFYENNCPFIRGKLIPYPNKVCKDYTYSAMKEQEKPSEDLEEAAEEYADKHGFRVPYDGSNNYYDDVDVKASKEGFLAGAEWRAKCKDSLQVPETCKENKDSFTDDLDKAAKHYAYIDWSSDEDIFAFEIKKYDAFIAGAEWQRKQECGTSKVIPR